MNRVRRHLLPRGSRRPTETETRRLLAQQDTKGEQHLTPKKVQNDLLVPSPLEMIPTAQAPGRWPLHRMSLAKLSCGEVSILPKAKIEPAENDEPWSLGFLLGNVRT